MPGGKHRKVHDEPSLDLLVRKTGSQLWRQKCRFAVRELSLGPCPLPQWAYFTEKP